MREPRVLEPSHNAEDFAWRPADARAFEVAAEVFDHEPAFGVLVERAAEVRGRGALCLVGVERPRLEAADEETAAVRKMIDDRTHGPPVAPAAIQLLRGEVIDDIVDLGFELGHARERCVAHPRPHRCEELRELPDRAIPFGDHFVRG